MRYIIKLGMLSVFVSCTSTTKNTSQKYIITRYVKAESSYRYSDDTINYRSNNYKPLLSAEYHDDTLASIKLFKAEGAIFYSIDNLRDDSTFLNTLDIPTKRTIEFIGGKIKDNEVIYEITEQVNDSVYSLRQDTLILYYIN
ncbi:MAG: hypothetical protein EOP56_00020 [Sphingobacteriales bacterium]|nr:MAG: hypothetical protein EOP56_00020 [Sphingobacteriales bacterium]